MSSLTAQKARSLGRLELLAWLNRFVSADYASIQDLRDGVAFVKIFDVMYPKKQYLSRLVDRAMAPKDFERNFNVLDSILRSIGVKNRAIDAVRLAEGSFRDLHELLQWFHWYVGTQAPEMSQVPEPLRRRKEFSANGISALGDGLALSHISPQPSGGRSRGGIGSGGRDSDDFVPYGGSGLGDFDAGGAELDHDRGSGGGAMIRRGGAAASPPPFLDMEAAANSSRRWSGGGGGGDNDLGGGEQQQQHNVESPSALQEARYVKQELEAIIPALELDLTRQLREQQALQATIEEICIERDGLFDTLRAVERACELLPSDEESAITLKVLDVLHGGDT